MPRPSRSDLLTILNAGIAAASAARALARVVHEPALAQTLRSTPVHVIAAGKAAADMIGAWCATADFATRTAVAIGTHRSRDLPKHVEWHEAGHPLPDERSVAAATRALAIAREVPPDEALVILLSGGASALMALPMEDVTLADKQRVVNAMLKGGADIHALNTLRKHLSAVKGGRLAAACRARTITLAISDVVGDDLAVIGSGPGIADPSTWRDAQAAVNRHVPLADQPPSVRALIERGVSGALPDTPKPGDSVTSRVQARVIAGRFDAMAGARAEAERLGYRVKVIDGAVTGEARRAALAWLDGVKSDRGCVISSGETTVRVTGRGKGGRNQEFALALAAPLAALGGEVAAGSAGTDGIDGPTDAAGAIVDSTTFGRASALSLHPDAYLDDNNAYAFFDALGDLIRTGPTGTNVGDLQVLLR
jgi:hydroxypyruvate reductase